MTRLQTLESNAYDVLGVSPNASAQAIDDVFRRLIDGGGYRIGVPLRGQWLRAHQIKEAYATLGDPIKRRAYDESLKGSFEPPLWPAASRNDPSLTALLRPLGGEQLGPMPKSTDGPASGDGEREIPAAGAIGSGNDEIDPYVEQRPASPGDGESEQIPAEAIESRSDEIVPDLDQRPTSPGDGESEQVPAEAIESRNDEIDPYVDQFATSPLESRNEVNYGPAKLWGGAAAAALALGSLVYFSWPIGNPELPGTERAAQLPPSAQQANSGTPATGRLAELPPAVSPDGSFGDVRVERPDDAASGADGVSESVETAGATQPAAATETAVPGAVPEKTAVATETQTGPGAAALGGEAASATAPAQAPLSSGATSTAAAPAPAPIPPRAEVPSAVPPSRAARSGVSLIRSPAQLIGGGPTHSDNPRGRHVGSVVVQFTVQADGRVSNCGAVRSSGKASLDALTCRLVEERMRFKPALDGQGNPVASTAHARYEWGRRRRQPSLLSSIFRWTREWKFSEARKQLSRERNIAIGRAGGEGASVRRPDIGSPSVLQITK